MRVLLLSLVLLSIVIQHCNCLPTLYALPQSVVASIHSQYYGTSIRVQLNIICVIQ